MLGRLVVLHLFAGFSTSLHIWPKMPNLPVFRHIWGPYMWPFGAISPLLTHIWGSGDHPVRSQSFLVVSEERLPVAKHPDGRVARYSGRIETTAPQLSKLLRQPPTFLSPLPQSPILQSLLFAFRPPPTNLPQSSPP
jgi:hypothetical protein